MSSLAIWQIIYCLSEIIKEQIEENTWGELQFAPTRLTINH